MNKVPIKSRESLPVFDVEILTDYLSKLLERIVTQGDAKPFFRSKLFAFEPRCKSNNTIIKNHLTVCKRNINKKLQVDLVEVDYADVAKQRMKELGIKEQALMSIAKDRLFFFGFGQIRPGNWRVAALVNKSIMTMLAKVMENTQRASVPRPLPVPLLQPPPVAAPVIPPTPPLVPAPSHSIDNALRLVKQFYQEPKNSIPITSILLNQSISEVIKALLSTRTTSVSTVPMSIKVRNLAKLTSVITKSSSSSGNEVLVANLTALPTSQVLMSIGWLDDCIEDNLKIGVDGDERESAETLESSLARDIEGRISTVVENFQGHYAMVSPPEHMFRDLKLNDDCIRYITENALRNLIRKSRGELSFIVKTGGAGHNSENMSSIPPPSGQAARFPGTSSNKCFLVTYFTYNNEHETSIKFKLRMEIDMLAQRKKRKACEFLRG